MHAGREMEARSGRCSAPPLPTCILRSHLAPFLRFEAPLPGQWLCGVCKFYNEHYVSLCEICAKAPLPHHWQCKACGFYNEPDLLLCEMCDPPRREVAQDNEHVGVREASNVSMGASPGDSSADLSTMGPSAEPRTDVVNAVVGMLLACGGTFAYMRKGNMPSLVGGVGSGVALLGSGALVKRGPKRAFTIGALVSALLATVMLLRVWKTRKVMPAGMVALLGALAFIHNGSELRRHNQ